MLTKTFTKHKSTEMNEKKQLPNKELTYVSRANLGVGEIVDSSIGFGRMYIMLNLSRQTG